MATRMQQRRGTAAQWTSANPILAVAEIGYESDTGKFKIGDGTNHWADLTYFTDAASISALIDGAPDLLNTLNELAAALGDDPDFIGTVNDQFFTVGGQISTINNEISQLANLVVVEGIDSDLQSHINASTNIHGIADTAALATNASVQEAVGNLADSTDTALTNLGNQLNTISTDQTAALSDLAGIVDTLSTDTDASIAGLQTSIDDHTALQTSVHGISNTQNLVYTNDSRLSDERTPTDGTVTTAKIVNDAVITSKIADSNITTAKIADNAITNVKMADNAVDTAEIKDGAVTNAKLAGSIDQSKITDLDLSFAAKQDKVAHVSDAEIGYLDGVTSSIQDQIDAKAPIASPTFTGTVSGITKSMVGLGNVNNTTDADKPVSSATQTALDLKAPIASPTFTGTVSGVTKEMVGLGNVNNTSDANKPVSTATQTALDAKAPIASPTFTGTVSGITKSMVGLGNVDNTSDADKPVSTATQTALDLKAPLASPTFTGTTTAADVTITGNLTVSGTTTTVDSANLAVTDSLIYLAKNQYSADALDIGIYGAYGSSGNNGGNHPHTGLVRDASDGKWKLISGGAEPTSNEVDFTTATKDTLVIGALDATSATIGNVSNTELQYLDGVTSAIQTQIDAKAPLASPTFTGTVTLPTGTVTSGMILDGTIVNADINASAAIAATKISGTAVTQADTGTVTNTMLAGSIAASKISGTAITASDTGTVTSTMIADGTIVNADISASAAIATSKISGLDSALSAKAPLASPTFTGTVNAAAITATGAITASSSGVVFTDGTQTKEGVPSRTPIVQKTASYTLSALTERDSVIEIASSSGVTLTVPANSAVAFPVGTSIDILQTSTGQITVAGDTGVTVNATPGLKLRTQWSGATLFKRATDTWVLYGDLSA